MSKNSKVQHYHLVAGMVLFVREGSDEIEQMNLNTTLTGDDRNVTARQIGIAQQGLQMRLFERVGPQVEVKDVFIISVSYLGQMTPEKFVEGVKDLQNAA